MGYRTRQLLRWARGISLVVAVGSIVAAMNWHGIWRSTALVGAQQSPPTTSLHAVEAQATFQQWVIVALIGLAITVASCVFPVDRAAEEPLELAGGRG
jgi:cytochrome c oxidase subunit IV